jgi:hypothetical protein
MFRVLSSLFVAIVATFAVPPFVDAAPLISRVDLRSAVESSGPYYVSFKTVNATAGGVSSYIVATDSATTTSEGAFVTADGSAIFGSRPATIPADDTIPPGSVETTLTLRLDSTQWTKYFTAERSFAPQFSSTTITAAQANVRVATFFTAIQKAIDLRGPTGTYSTPNDYVVALIQTLDEVITITAHGVPVTYTGTHILDDTSSQFKRPYGDGVLQIPYPTSSSGTKLVFTGTVRDLNVGPHGTMQWPNGAQAVGEFIQGVLNTGRITLSNGDYYDGRFEVVPANFAEFDIGGTHLWLFKGTGLVSYPDGRYEGDLLANYPRGQGKYSYADGEVMTGTWNVNADGPANHSVLPDGSVWIMPYSAGAIGTGPYDIRYADGTRVTGTATKGVLGAATVTLPDGTTSSGTWNGMTLHYYVLPTIFRCDVSSQPFARGYCLVQQASNGQWLRGSLAIDRRNGKIEVSEGLETDNLTWGICGYVSWKFYAADGSTLGTGKTSEKCIPCKSPGTARIVNFPDTIVSDDAAKLQRVMKFDLLVNETRQPPGLFGFTIDPISVSMSWNF